ncbi:hypothetical protein NM463_001800 [Citrobacter koseri]
MVADYTRWGTGATGKWKDEKKPAHPRRLVQETGTKSVPNNLTNQYLWDLDCGLRRRCAPPAKRKGMNTNATSCVNYRLLLQIAVSAKKKPAHDAQVGVILVINPKADFTYQYLWDLNSSNPPDALTSEQSQQRFAKCNQRFAFSLFCLTSPACAHICAFPSGNLLEQIAIFRNTDEM